MTFDGFNPRDHRRVREDHLLETDGHRPWCLRCRRPATVCLCPTISTLTTRTRVVILMHPKEAKKTKNGTGRITHLSLPNSEIHVGVDFREHPRVQELLADESLDCRLLYPAHSNAAPSRKRAGAPVLFVLDGTWPCAKKMMKLNTNLHGLPRVSPGSRAPSEFITKHQPDPACLSTIEAVARTLETRADEGVEDWTGEDSEALLRPFRRMIALSLAHAAAVGPKSYRPSGPFKRPEARTPTRSNVRSGRNIVYLG